jgi:hypothetical protein
MGEASEENWRMGFHGPTLGGNPHGPPRVAQIIPNRSIEPRHTVVKSALWPVGLCSRRENIFDPGDSLLVEAGMLGDVALA